MQDYDSYFVPGLIEVNGNYKTPTRTLEPYMKSAQIWSCPSDTNPVRDTRPVLDEPYVKSYIVNPLVHGDAQGLVAEGNVQWPVNPLLETSVTKPAETISFFESYWAAGYDGSGGAVPYPLTRNNNGPLWSPTNGASSPTLTQLEASNIAYKRHLEGSNYLFIDGHVKFLKWNATLAPNWLWNPQKP